MSSSIVYPKITPKHVIRIFVKGAREYPVSFFLTCFTVFVNGIIPIIPPLFYKQFIDIASTATDPVLVYPDLIRVLFFILGTNILYWIFHRVAAFSNSFHDAFAMMRIRELCFEHLLGHSYSFFANNFGGSLVQRVNRLARSYENITDRIFWDLCPLLFRICGSIIALWLIRPAFAIVLIVWASSVLTVQFFFSRYKVKFDFKVAEEDSRTTGVLADAITNHATIDLFNGQKSEHARFHDASLRQALALRTSWWLDNGSSAITNVFSIIAEFTIFYITAKYYASGLVTVGIFSLFQIYFIGISDKLFGFNRIIRDFYRSYADAKEMVEIIELPYEIKDVPTAQPLMISGGEVTFQNVGFSYSGTRDILKSVSLTIKAGEKIALVGPSGAGKSTFVRLLLRLYNISQGKILIDGLDILHGTLESLRDAISFVPQDPILFHRTLLDNIRYGRPSATDEEVREAARLAHCDEFIQGFPQQYETFVGERGVKLSGGERQRVAIARAILKNAPILILDEATSSLDSHSEGLIQDALEELMKGKTVIVIAHRLSTIRKMDRIVVLQDGSVLEEGTHDVLVHNPESLYGKLWSLQAGGFLQG